MKCLRVWPCKDIDLSWLDIAYAVRMCLATHSGRSRKAELPIKTDGEELFCMSVRAAFDLYLCARAWGYGEECIFVGINVPDMFRIAESHGLSVRVTDIDPITTEVDLMQLQACINPRTRFIVVPHLFGHRLDLRSVVELANRHEVDVVEDCAQAFAGKCWWGTQGVTLSLFSFGPMKTATALQGAVAIVRDSKVYDSMKCELSSYPVHPTRRYFLRVARFAAMKIATQPLIYGFLFRVFKLFRVNHETIIHAVSKSTAGVSFNRWLRMQPCTALKRVIARKANRSEYEIQLRMSKGSILFDAIGEGVPLVLRDRQPNTFWMVPVLVDDPDGFKNALRKQGFDAMSGRLVTVNCEETKGAKTLSNAVMLPFSPLMSDIELHRLGVVATKYHSDLIDSAGFGN